MISRYSRSSIVLAAGLVVGCSLASMSGAQAQAIDLPVYRTAPVTAITPLVDGRALVAGEFEYLNGEPTIGQVLRLDEVGALDPAFRVVVGGVLDPDAAGSVRAMVAAPSGGEVFLAGAFSRVQGEQVTGLAKLDASGALTPWRAVPGPGETALIFVDALVGIAPGTLLAVAAMEARAGPQILRVDAASGVYETLHSVAGNVTAVLPEPDGSVLIGGTFLGIGATPTGNIARLLPGTLQAQPGPFFRTEQGVTALARSPIDGLLHVGANRRVERVLESGSLDPKYFVAANGPIHRLLFDDSGRLYLAGSFSIVNAAPRARIARVAADGTLDASWQAPELRGDARHLRLVAGRLLVGGTVVSTATNEAGLMVVPTGAIVPASPLPTLRLGRAVPEAARLLAMRATPDGGAIIAGSFSHTREAVTGPILRLDADGSLRTDWSPLLDLSFLGDMAVADDGSLYLSATMALGPALDAASQVVRVLPQGGGFDPAWRLVSSAFGPPTALAVAGSQIYLGGQFPALNGVSQPGLARAGRIGPAMVDASWTPACASFTCATGQIVVRADGSVITMPAPWSDGSVDFNPPPPPGPPIRLLSLVTTAAGGDEVVSVFGPPVVAGLSRVDRLQIDAQQRLYLTGLFRTVGPPVLDSLARVLPDGSLDAGFVPNLGAQRVAAGPAELTGNGYLYLLTRSLVPGQPRQVRRVDIASGTVDADWTPSSPAIESATHLVRTGDRILVVGPAPAPGPQGSFLRVEFLPQESPALFADSFE